MANDRTSFDSALDFFEDFETEGKRIQERKEEKKDNVQQPDIRRSSSQISTKRVTYSRQSNRCTSRNDSPAGSVAARSSVSTLPEQVCSVGDVSNIEEVIRPVSASGEVPEICPSPKISTEKLSRSNSSNNDENKSEKNSTPESLDKCEEEQVEKREENLCFDDINANDETRDTTSLRSYGENTYRTPTPATSEKEAEEQAEDIEEDQYADDFEETDETQDSAPGKCDRAMTATPEPLDKTKEEQFEEIEEDRYSDDFDENEDTKDSPPLLTDFSEVTIDTEHEKSERLESYRTSSMPVAKASPMSTDGFSVSTVLGLCDKQSQNIQFPASSEASGNDSLEPFQDRNVYVLTDPSAQEIEGLCEVNSQNSRGQLIKTPIGANSKALSFTSPRTSLPKIQNRSFTTVSAKAASAVYHKKIPTRQNSKNSSVSLPKIPRQLKSEAVYRDGTLEISIHGLPGLVPEKYSSAKYNLGNSEINPPMPVSLVFLAGKKESAKRRPTATHSATKQRKPMLYQGPDREILQTRAAWPGFNTKMDPHHDERPPLYRDNVSQQIPRRSRMQSRATRH